MTATTTAPISAPTKKRDPRTGLRNSATLATVFTILGHTVFGFEQPLSVETVDIMPTLAGLIGLELAPGSVDGRCLDLVVGPETSCPAH